MPTARKLFAMVAFNGSIYAVGGVVDGNVVATVEQYRTESNLWSTAMPMIMPRSAAAAAVMNEHIYILGGATKANSGETATVERFDGHSWMMVNEIKSTSNNI